VDLPLTRSVLDAGQAGGACPAVAIEVGRSQRVLWRHAAGRLTFDPASAPATPKTIFDLASLTKVIATTSVVMRHVSAGRLTIDTPLGDLLPDWADGERQRIRIRHLLDHSSGLPAHVRLWEQGLSGRADYERAIRALPLERPAGAQSVYSDVGFIVLGFALEVLASRSLDQQLADMGGETGVHVCFNPPPGVRARIAPTEFDPWRNRLLVGEVHDENAAALGGVAGHAGLFGTAEDVGDFARMVLRTFVAPTPLGTVDVMRSFAGSSGVPLSSRALGWDLMRPTSSCGTRLSATSIGHTGFTGTSLWIDPDRDLYVVLLSNRVHPTRGNELFAALRPKVHDAVVEDLEGPG
jgi:CubicO group peptidase (beta-lactamase class C family)